MFARLWTSYKPLQTTLRRSHPSLLQLSIMRSSFAVLLAVASAALAAPFTFNLTSSVAKRDYENVPFTWYNTGLGACGETNNDGDFIAAIGHGGFDSFP